MENHFKITDKKEKENLFNKKKRSKDASIKSTKHHIIHNQEISNGNNKFDIEDDDFINKILSEKINSLNISEHDFIISSANSNSSYEDNNSCMKFDYNNDHIFVNDTMSLKNNSLKHSDFDITIDNISSNTENLLLTPQINKTKENKNRYRKDNHILSDMYGINNKNVSDKNDISFLHNKKGKENGDEENTNYIISNDNIDLLFKKKINRNSFLDGLESDNTLKPVLSYHKKTPSIHSIKSEPSIETNSIFKENLILNSKISKTPTFKPVMNFSVSDNLNESELYDYKFRMSGSKYDSENDKSFLSNSKEITDITEEITGPTTDRMNLSIGSVDSVFEFDILNSNSIGNRINFLKEKVLDLQGNSNKEMVSTSPTITITNTTVDNSYKVSPKTNEIQNSVVINNNNYSQNSDGLERITEEMISDDDFEFIKPLRSQTDFNENVISVSPKLNIESILTNKIENKPEDQNQYINNNNNNNNNNKLTGDSEFQKLVEIIQNDKIIDSRNEQNEIHLNEDDIPIKEKEEEISLGIPQNNFQDEQINLEHLELMEEQVFENHNREQKQIKDSHSEIINQVPSINLLKTRLEKIEDMEQDIVNCFYSANDAEFNEYLSTHYDINKATKKKNKPKKSKSHKHKNKIKKNKTKELLENDKKIEIEEAESKKDDLNRINSNSEEFKQVKENNGTQDIIKDNNEEKERDSDFKFGELKHNNNKSKDFEVSEGLNDVQEKLQQLKIEKIDFKVSEKNEISTEELKQEVDKSILLDDNDGANNSNEEIEPFNQENEKSIDLNINIIEEVHIDSKKNQQERIKDESNEQEDLISNEKEDLNQLISENITEINDESEKLINKMNSNCKIYEKVGIIKQDNEVDKIDINGKNTIEINENDKNKLNYTKQDQGIDNSNVFSKEEEKESNMIESESIEKDKITELKDDDEADNNDIKNIELKIQENIHQSEVISEKELEINSNIQYDKVDSLENLEDREKLEPLETELNVEKSIVQNKEEQKNESNIIENKTDDNIGIQIMSEDNKNDVENQDKANNENIETEKNEKDIIQEVISNNDKKKDISVKVSFDDQDKINNENVEIEKEEEINNQEIISNNTNEKDINVKIFEDSQKDIDDQDKISIGDVVIEKDEKDIVQEIISSNTNENDVNIKISEDSQNDVENKNENIKMDENEVNNVQVENENEINNVQVENENEINNVQVENENEINNIQVENENEINSVQVENENEINNVQVENKNENIQMDGNVINDVKEINEINTESKINRNAFDDSQNDISDISIEINVEGLKEEDIEISEANECKGNSNEPSLNFTHLLDESERSSSSNVQLHSTTNSIFEGIPKSFSINYPTFSENGDNNSNCSFDNSYDERNNDSVITLFEPALQVDISDTEYNENDHLGNYIIYIYSLKKER